MSSATIQNQHNNTYQRGRKNCTYCELHNLECITTKPPATVPSLGISIKQVTHNRCIREQIMLVLLFASFPFCGICITDFTFILIGPGYQIPVSHLIICTCSLLIIACSYITLWLHSAPRAAMSKYILSKNRK
ncbi:hypothetical protein SAMN04487890_101447 [Mucilaginibacter polytrichastri]|nr:hypothetical protein SAMN04487890_101447 [Mucilaginibacter polytrichastri]